jgi:hypothetical protein
MSEQTAPVLSLTEIQEIINTKAREIARQAGFRTDNFRVELVRKVHANGMSEVYSGATVRICLKWPDVLPTINTQLLGWLRLINSRRGIWTPLAINNIAYSREERKRSRRLSRRHVSNDPADEFPELIPQFRVRVRRSTTTIYEDMITGEVVQETVETVEGLRTNKIEPLWQSLSERVRANYPEQFEDEPDE